jgi:uncharacterized protein DUF222/HNH endonuclease
MCDAPALEQPGSPGEAVAAVTAGLAYLARTDAASLGTAAQSDCLKALERAEAMHTAARVNVLAAFHAAGGCEPDGSGSTRAWLVWQTRVTRGAAAGAVGWMRRLRGHPAVWEALAAGTVSASWAKQICDWTDRLPEVSRGDADAILLTAAAGGVSLHDLGALAEEMALRARLQEDDDRDGFEDRAVWFAQTFRSAGRLEGDLTPAASAALKAVLESLGAKVGPEDVRSQRQRWHDALEEACVRLIASGMLPRRAGQPVHLQLQITLDQLRQMAAAGASTAESAWAASATASGLTPAEVEGLACDATVFPVVTGMADNTALDRLVQFVLNAYTHHQPTPEHIPGITPASDGRTPGKGDTATGSGSSQPGAGLPPGLRSAQALRQALLALAADVLSGPGGLASLLRTGTPAVPFPTVSLPLDAGSASEVIPGYLRRLVILRDKHCQFPGCWQPPDACQVHHLIHRADGGPTSLANCYLVCRFHHLIAIHRWGWKLAANPDGTTTATHPTGRTLHSHPPPSQAA